MERGVMPLRQIVGDLLFATPFGLAHGPLHGIGHLVRIQDGAAMQVARGAAYGLDQRALGTQKTLFVGIQYGHQGHLGNVQALAQQVDAHQHVKGSQAQIAQNFHPLHRIHIAVQVAHLDAVVGLR
jgi:hypothetical protein